VPLESTIKDSILKWLRAQNFYATKTHGEAMQERGLPDIFACVYGLFVAIEVKQPGMSATPIQQYHLGQISTAGGLSWVVDSLQDVVDRVGQITRS